MLAKYVKRIKEEPLTSAHRELFINREGELEELKHLLEYFEGEIIGVCGERGCGKTSIFNILELPRSEKVIINIVNRENKTTVLFDIVYELKEEAERRGWVESAKRLEKLLELFNEAEEIVQVGISQVIEVSKGVSKKRITPFSTIVKELRAILYSLGEKKKVAVMIDEIDKEGAEEVLRIIDAIKEAFVRNKVTLVVALPYSIYKEFKSARKGEDREHNVENVFSHMVEIKSMKDGDIVKLIEKRIPLRYLERGALSLIVLYAGGNPRRAITALKEAGVMAALAKKERIERIDVVLSLRKYFAEEVEGFSEKEREVLEVLEEVHQRAVVKKLVERGWKEPTAYKYLQKLEEKGEIKIKEGQVIISRKVSILKALGLV